MAAKFVMKKAPTGEFYYHLISPGGTVLLESKSYGSRAAAIKAIEAVRKHAAEAMVVDGSPATTMTPRTVTRPARPIKARARKPSRPIKRAAAKARKRRI